MSSLDVLGLGVSRASHIRVRVGAIDLIWLALGLELGLLVL